MNFPEIQTRLGPTNVKSVEQSALLEQPADGGWGDESHGRQQRSGPAGAFARLVMLNQASSNAVKDFLRQAAQHAGGAAEQQVSAEQDGASSAEAFLRSVALRCDSNKQVQRKFDAVVDSAAAVRQQSHLAEASLREYAVLGFVDTPDAPDAGPWRGETLAQLRKLEAPAPLTPEVLNQPNSSADFFEQLLAMIGQIRGEYLAVYEELLRKYSDFYKEFNEEVMAKMQDWIKGSTDGKSVDLNVGVLTAINRLIAKYSAQPTGVLFPIPDKDGNLPPATEADAKKWAEAMGMGKDSPNVKPDGKGGFVVMMDLSALNTMQANLIPLFQREEGMPPWHVVRLDSAKFNAWKSGFDNQESELKNQLQMFTTKYSNANSYHENFNKILSSQLSMYSEMLTQMARAIA